MLSARFQNTGMAYTVIWFLYGMTVWKIRLEEDEQKKQRSTIQGQHPKGCVCKCDWKRSFYYLLICLDCSRTWLMAQVIVMFVSPKSFTLWAWTTSHVQKYTHASGGLTHDQCYFVDWLHDNNRDIQLFLRLITAFYSRRKQLQQTAKFPCEIPYSWNTIKL